MSGVAFDTGYADAYDHFYSEKDYEAECDLIEAALRRFGDGSVSRILDLGCGTGNHSIPLMSRGYEVTGVDISLPMLELAREKAKSLPKTPNFIHGDVRTVDLNDSGYDAVLMMFAVLGYQTGNDDVVSALNTVSRHLRPGGVLLFDVWYGPGVLMTRPEDRAKTVNIPGGELVRKASSTLDVRRHLCEVRYEVTKSFNNGTVDKTEETHVMRYFFPMELDFFLSRSGFSLETLSAFPDLDMPASDSTWNALAVASRVNQ